MPRKTSKRARPKPKTVLRLPDLDQAKSAVLNSLSSVDAQRGYRHAIDEFVEWYCSEPRLSFSRTVVLRYRIHLESRALAPGDDKPSPGSRSPVGLRGRGLRTPEPGLGRRHSASQGREETRGPPRKLANLRAISEAVAGSERRTAEGEA